MGWGGVDRDKKSLTKVSNSEGPGVGGGGGGGWGG